MSRPQYAGAFFTAILLTGIFFSLSEASVRADGGGGFSHPMPSETNQPPLEPTSQEMAAVFADPVGKIRTGAYWYWLSGNVSSEGVAADVRAMKSVGIDRAYIGDIGVDSSPRGPVKTFSPAWWDAIHTALKTATDEGVEIGIFNSPGWSQSGGPWVGPERAMRYLSGATIEVAGPGRTTLSCPNRSDEAQDVRILAFRKPKNESLPFPLPTEGLARKAGEAATLSVTSGQPFTARSLTIEPLETPINVEGAVLEAKKGDAFERIAEFAIHRQNPELNVGFIPFAPIVVSFPAVTANEFRLTLPASEPLGGIQSVRLDSAPRIASYAEKSLAKMHPTPQPMWSDYQWPAQAPVDDPAAMIDPATMIDLTEKLEAGRPLEWDAPDGEWLVFWTWALPTGTKNAPAVPEATGYETDKMSRTHIAYHFDAMMGEILRKIPEADRKSFKIVVQDSYEVGGQNFTDDLIPRFKERYGYDPTPFLPTLFGQVVASPDDSDRFLWDLRRFIADQVAYSYVGGLREASNARGLSTWLECYGHWGFPGEFLQYGGQSDEIAGEYWSEGTLGDIENRIASSCGHIYGKRKIWAESNTCAGAPYSRSPIDMKVRTDRFFSEGINQSLLHLYVQQPDDRVPGLNAWFGNEFNRHNTWFPQLDLFTTYLKRVNYLLQLGTNCADVAYFIGEDAPKMTGAVDPPLPPGYQFDFINAEVLEASATVQDGLLTLPHGTCYELLVLPKLETMRPELLEKIDSLVKAGAVVLGPRPNRSPSLQNQPAADAEVKKIAGALWDDIDAKNVYAKTVGAGMIADGLSLEQMFDHLNLPPDCQIERGLPLVYGHRALEKADIYFLANQSDKPIDAASVVFRTEKRKPSLWFPASGTIRPCRAWKPLDDGRIEVPLAFAARESYFVVFETGDSTPPETCDAAANFPVGTVLARLGGPWRLTFDSGEIARGPSEPVEVDALFDWSRSDDPAIRFYSGTVRYRTIVSLEKRDESKRALLALGKAAEMAKVFVNGRCAGGVWTEPYTVDVTDFLKEGENVVEIEVVNTWVNRLVGDAALPEGERKTFTSVNPYTSESPLKSSGLLGPVEIREY